MENEQYQIEFITTPGEVRNMAGAVAELQKQTHSLCAGIREAFQIRGRLDYFKTASRYGKEMASALLVLQLRMGMLRNSIADAVMPLASVFVPVINRAVLALVRFFGTVSQVLWALFGTGKAAKKAAAGQKAFSNSLRATGKNAARTLAAFDQLERLGKASGGSRGTGIVGLPTKISDTLTPQVQVIVAKILKILEPIRNMDFSRLRESFAEFHRAMAQFLSVVGVPLRWLWFQVLMPLAKWTIEQAAPAAVDALSQAFLVLSEILKPAITAIGMLSQALAPVAEFAGKVLVGALGLLGEKLASVARIFGEKSGAVTNAFQKLSQSVLAIWQKLLPALSAAVGEMRKVFNGFLQVITGAISGAISVFNGLITFLSQVFSGEFQAAWATIQTNFTGWMQSLGEIADRVFGGSIRKVTGLFKTLGTTMGAVFNGTWKVIKGAANGIIGLINGLVSGVTAGMNGMIRALNKFHISVPEWVPGIGGKYFGFNLSPLTAPSIPYLARGAVLPANKPFLAMVGDQKHGTNIEAPLSTIQEAVGTVMGSMESGMMAGFQASVEVQKQILEAVLGIRIGDDVIGNAYRRYVSRMNVVNGGGMM